jgi:hypothetical protein
MMARKGQTGGVGVCPCCTRQRIVEFFFHIRGVLLQVMGDTSGSMLGRDLEALIERARGHKKEYGDSFISVEHLVLGFVQDKRFGQQLFRDFQLSAKSLNAAIQAIRGSQKVTDQGIPLQILFAVLVSSASRRCKN